MRTVLGWICALLLGVGSAGAQATTASGVLGEMAAEAGVIFTGRVDGVTRADAAGYVDVRFRVEHGMKGASDGGVYVLREWAGLWTGGAVRYQSGQRLLLLLAGRGPSGMSAPVGGLDGAVPLFSGEDGVDRVDLRWVRARAMRATVAGTGGGVGDVGQAHADPVDLDWPGPVAPMASVTTAGEPDLASVLALLGGSGGR